MVSGFEILRALEMRTLTFLSTFLEDGENAVTKNWDLEHHVSWFESRIASMWTEQDPLGVKARPHLKTTAHTLRSHCLLSQVWGTIGFLNLFMMAHCDSFGEKILESPDETTN